MNEEMQKKITYNYDLMREIGENSENNIPHFSSESIDRQIRWIQTPHIIRNKAKTINLS